MFLWCLFVALELSLLNHLLFLLHGIELLRYSNIPFCVSTFSQGNHFGGHLHFMSFKLHVLLLHIMYRGKKNSPDSVKYTSLPPLHSAFHR